MCAIVDVLGHLCAAGMAAGCGSRVATQAVRGLAEQAEPLPRIVYG